MPTTIVVDDTWQFPACDSASMARNSGRKSLKETVARHVTGVSTTRAGTLPFAANNDCNHFKRAGACWSCIRQPYLCLCCNAPRSGRRPVGAPLPARREGAVRGSEQPRRICQVQGSSVNTGLARRELRASPSSGFTARGGSDLQGEWSPRIGVAEGSGRTCVCPQPP